MRIFSTLGLLLSILSISALALNVFEAGTISTTIVQVLAYYEQLLEVCLGWTEPLLRSLSETIQRALNIQLELHSHWRHVFVLMWLYFSADVKNEWRVGRRGNVAALVLIGGLVSFVSSALFGSVSLNDAPANLLVVLAPWTGIALYDLIRNAIAASFWRSSSVSWWEAFRKYLAYPIRRWAVGAGAICAIAVLEVLGWLPSVPLIGLASFAVLVAGLGVYWAWWANRLLQSPGFMLPDETRRAAFVRAKGGAISSLMLATILGVALFMIANAGLASFGL